MRPEDTQGIDDARRRHEARRKVDRAVLALSVAFYDLDADDVTDEDADLMGAVVAHPAVRVSLEKAFREAAQ